MNVFVPLFIVVVAVCWFLVYTGRVAPTDRRLLLCIGGAMAAGAVFFLYAYVRAGHTRADAMRRLAETFCAARRAARRFSSLTS